MIPEFIRGASPVRGSKSGGPASSSIPAPLPPLWFKPLRGKPYGASFAASRPMPRGSTEARRAGIRYEKKVLKALGKEFGSRLTASPTIHFFDEGGMRRIIPDALLYLGPLDLAILEIKISHRSDTWFQANELYRPVVRLLTRPEVRLHVIEVCKSYDPDVVFPWPHDVIMDLKVPPSGFGVFPWKL